MPVTAPRFRSDSTLNACVDAGYRMTFGDPNTESVRKVQFALIDLGYPPQHGADGIFGPSTGEMVSAFKTDEVLAATDPVVGKTTMERLDTYFANETSTPDSPDSTTAGLTELAQTAMATAVAWISTTIDALNQWPSDEQHPEDPAWIAFDEALNRNFHTGAAGTMRQTILDRIITPNFHGAKRAIDPVSPFLILEALTQSVFHSENPLYRYAPCARAAGAILYVTPPFRNVTDDVARAAWMIQYAVEVSWFAADVLGFPGTARYGNAPAQRAVYNSVAYAAFVLEVGAQIEAAAIQSFIGPMPKWDLGPTTKWH